MRGAHADPTRPTLIAPRASGRVRAARLVQAAVATLFDRAPWRADLRQAIADAFRDGKFVLSEDEYDAWRTATDTQAAATVLAEVEKGARPYKVPSGRRERVWAVRVVPVV